MSANLGDPRYEKTVVSFLPNQKPHGEMRVFYSGFEAWLGML